MIKIGPRRIGFVDVKGNEIDVDIWFEIDGQARGPEEPDLRSCAAIIAKGGTQDIIRGYAQDHLQACHRLMSLSSAYLAQMADAEELTPRLGDLPGDIEGFALFRY